MLPFEGPDRAAALEPIMAGLNVLAIGDRSQRPLQVQECCEARDSDGLVAVL